METPIKTKSVMSTKTIVTLAAAVVLAVVIGAVVVATHQQEDTSGPTIGYAAEAKVLLDQDSLQASMDKAMENAKNGNVSLSYKDNAYSSDGSTFECYIVNSANNLFDMYLDIYADAEMTDELYRSGLVPPGSGFDSLTLEHSLDVGDHMVYVVFTQVDTDEETGEQQVRNQVVYTMDFHVQD
jgi:hypothetical protein